MASVISFSIERRRDREADRGVVVAELGAGEGTLDVRVAEPAVLDAAGDLMPLSVGNAGAGAEAEGAVGRVEWAEGLVDAGFVERMHGPGRLLGELPAEAELVGPDVVVLRGEDRVEVLGEPGGAHFPALVVRPAHRPDEQRLRRDARLEVEVDPLRHGDFGGALHDLASDGGGEGLGRVELGIDRRAVGERDAQRLLGTS